MSAVWGGRKKVAPGAVLVIGLGRFGSAVAGELVRQGVEVMAVDEDAELVERWADELTYTAQVDATDEQALKQLGLADFEQVVVGIGADIEASVITTLTVSEAGVPQIWAKALTRKHGQILERVGANHVVYPERDTGQRVAFTIAGTMKDWMEFDDGMAIARTAAPEFTWDRPLAESAPRTRYHVTVIAVKPAHGDIEYAVPDTIIRRGDDILVAGMAADVKNFALLR
ncbi:potassium channel family protein [Naumannella cuiyingiana]|uniref:Trk system potassium uptake protein TrkA n=1 Tax=Naumannella cuiyingiana TaxID=1347891 RepID=A0A7Z0D9W6_9ACTN|nr:trk system potassium uptake protein TrkA [Naumannella cuiyingiana]